MAKAKVKDEFETAALLPEEPPPSWLMSRLDSFSVELRPRVRQQWEHAIFDRHRGQCSNCGGDTKVVVRPIVPFEVGGRLSFDNGVLLCRACSMASAFDPSEEQAVDRPVNFWVSDQLFEQLSTINGFKSRGSLVRFLMKQYTASPQSFDDLILWQDAKNDVKVNVWVDVDTYEGFKERTRENGLTVTDALRSLIMMFAEGVAPLLSQKE